MTIRRTAHLIRRSDPGIYHLSFAASGHEKVDHLGREAVYGVGDLVLRVKATVIREGSRALAAGLDTRLPTGDEQNLLGTGAMGMRP